MSEELKWYVVRAISGKEKKVKQYLEAEIKIKCYAFGDSSIDSYRKSFSNS